MKILTTVFSYPDKPHDYKALHDVFVASCKKHMPDVEVITLNLQVDYVVDGKKPGCWVNTAKLRAIVEYLESCNDDVIIADCDMLCTAPAYHAFDIPFDIAYTRKPENHKTSCPLNGGIIMVRNNAVALDWMKQLVIVNDAMYKNAKFHAEWKKKYYGMNQAAMGFMIESSHPARVHAYDTLTWNCVDCNWKDFNSDTVFVHIKGELRNAIQNRISYPDVLPIMQQWYSYTDNQKFAQAAIDLSRIRKKKIRHEINEVAQALNRRQGIL